MTVAVDPRLRLGRLRGRAERLLTEAFRISVARLRAALPLSRIEDAIASGRLEEVFVLFDAAWERVGREWAAAYEKAARSTARFLGGPFDGAGRAQRRIDSQVTRLIADLAAGQREASRQILMRGVGARLSPRALARELRDSAGLTARDAQAVENYRRGLRGEGPSATTQELRDRRADPTVRGGEPMPAARVRALSDRYRERLVEHRAVTIGVSEALRSTHEGDAEAKTQLVEAGLAQPMDILQVWHTKGDHKVRGTHTPMSGQVREFGESFNSGRGYALRWPGDPNAPASETVRCRCFLETRLRRPPPQ